MVSQVDTFGQSRLLPSTPACVFCRLTLHLAASSLQRAPPKGREEGIVGLFHRTQRIPDLCSQPSITEHVTSLPWTWTPTLSAISLCLTATPSHLLVFHRPSWHTLASGWCCSSSWGTVPPECCLMGASRVQLPVCQGDL